MRKIAILGTAPSFSEAPFDDETWEVWGISRLYKFIPRWDRWYELHELEEICRTWETGDREAEKAARADYMTFMEKAGDQLFLRGPRTELPDAQTFPLNDIMGWFSRGYFTNTISWLIAHAIYEIIESKEDGHIALYGVDMELASEYGTQRPSCEYLLGIAEGAGIEVTLPKACQLLKAARLYGFQDESPVQHAAREKARGLRLEMGKNERIMQKMQLEQAAQTGALEMCDWIVRGW